MKHSSGHIDGIFLPPPNGPNISVSKSSHLSLHCFSYKLGLLSENLFSLSAPTETQLSPKNILSPIALSGVFFFYQTPKLLDLEEEEVSFLFSITSSSPLFFHAPEYFHFESHVIRQNHLFIISYPMQFSLTLVPRLESKGNDYNFSLVYTHDSLVLDLLHHTDLAKSPLYFNQIFCLL